MSELLPCPFCGGEAFVNDDPTGNGGKPHMSGNVGLGRLWSVECDECGADAGFWQDRDVAIAAWNSRADYHGYEQAAIEAWESIKAWNSRAERTCECIAEYAESPIDGKKIVLHRCSACHKLMRPFMHYCPNCGKRIRKAVKR